MSNPSPEDLFSTWSEAQKRLWESLSSTMNTLQPPPAEGLWRDACLNHLATWEAAVLRSLEAQSQWVQRWSRQVGDTQGTPEAVAAWTHQVEEVMQQWIEAQNRAWEDWFRMVRESAPGQPGTASPAPPPVAPPPATPAAPQGDAPAGAQAEPAAREPQASAAAGAPEPAKKPAAPRPRARRTTRAKTTKG